MLETKRILLIVAGGIAAVKVPDLIRRLRERRGDQRDEAGDGQEALDRLEHLTQNGSSDHAFGWESLPDVQRIMQQLLLDTLAVGDILHQTFVA